MKQIFTFFIFFFSLSSFSQESEWFELGTTWTYHHFMALDFFGEEHQSIYTVTEEVVINGTPCKKIERMGLGDEDLFGCFALSDPYYVYESNDSVFFANDYDNTFRLAYDFNAEVGDSWIFEVPVENFDEMTTYEVTVSAVDTEMIDGQTLRSLTLDFEVVTGEEYSAIGHNSLQVLEHLGVRQNGFIIPFGDWNICDGAYDLKIQCFDSPTIDYVSPEFGSCVLSLDGVEPAVFVSVYPNPASDQITVQRLVSSAPLSGVVESIHITDLSGRVVAVYPWPGVEVRTSSMDTDQSRLELNVSELSSGWYLLQVVGTDGVLGTDRLVIQH